jgi:uncharacterized protein YhbP (UPF0306 family)
MTQFLKKHHVLNLAVCHNNVPWAASCFYVYDESAIRFVFTSDQETRHIADSLQQPLVSGTIALETSIIGKIRGIQFSGSLRECTGEEYTIAKKLYLKRFPFAAPFIGSTALWEIVLDHLKMTDNRLGFGKKLIWCKKA